MTQNIPLGSDARERFLMEIAAQVPPARIHEAHFFAPMRQGQLETGVCVLAVFPEGAEPVGVPTHELPAEATPEAVAEAEAAEDEAAGAGTEAAEAGAEAATEPVAEPEPAYPLGATVPSRHVVYSARYRWTRKGPERGKWECEVVAEADAPLLTVEAVVQGVQQRSTEPLAVEKLEGDRVRELIAAAEARWQKSA